MQRSKYLDLVEVAPNPNAITPPTLSSLPPYGATTFSPAVPGGRLDIKWGPAKRARLYLLDRSGSMGGERFKVAVRALVREIALAPKGMNLGVYAFSNRSEKFVPIGEIGMDSVGEIAQKRKMINDLVKSALNTEPYGSTALYRSLYDLFPILEREMNTRGIVLGDIIVISDGMDNYGGIKQET